MLWQNLYQIKHTLCVHHDTVLKRNKKKFFWVMAKLNCNTDKTLTQHKNAFINMRVPPPPFFPCTHTQVHMPAQPHTHTHTHAHTHTSPYTHTHTHCTHTHSPSTHTHTPSPSTHTHTHTHPHTHTHTHPSPSTQTTD